MYNMQWNCILRQSFFDMHIRRPSHLPSVVTDDASPAIMTVPARYEQLCKSCSSLGSRLGMSPVSEVWNGRHWNGGCARSLSWFIVSLKDKELTTDLAHDRQLLLSQKHVMVTRVTYYELHYVKEINEFLCKFL